MTPLEIIILLHYYWSPEDYTHIITAIPAPKHHLIAMGLLERDFNPGTQTRYKITQRGRAHVKALKNLPLPEQQWVTPEAEEQAQS